MYCAKFERTQKILAIVMSVLMCISLAACGLNSADKTDEPATTEATEAATQEATEEATQEATEGPVAEKVPHKENYTVQDDVARQNRDLVVATIGQQELTSGELQIYYWESVSNFISENYYYLSMYGLDISKPLNEQACPVASGLTWEQFFLENAINTWQRFTALQLAAEENNYQLDADMQSFLDGLPESMQKSATEYGFETVIAWLESNCGPGVSEEGYMEYVSAYYEGTFYLTSLYEELYPTEEDTNLYFEENEDFFAQSGVTKESGKYYDVRHILIPIEGGTKNEDGTTTYSDADWEACRDKAQKLLDEWAEKDGTEEGFGVYAMLNSTDNGSSSNGGLYENLTAETNFVQEFKDWYMDESRVPGNTGLVKSSYGYHIMYFSGSSDIWFDTAASELLTDRVGDVISAAVEKYPMEVDYEKIVIGNHSFV